MSSGEFMFSVSQYTHGLLLCCRFWPWVKPSQVRLLQIVLSFAFQI